MKSLVMTSGLFWPILASLLTMTTSTMHQEPGGGGSTGCANSENTHRYLIHQREKRASYEIDDEGNRRPKVCAKGDAICIPANYSKFDLPDEELTTVNVGIDIKDIPKIDDKEFSITLNAFFVVRWTDARMIIDQVRQHHPKNKLFLQVAFGEEKVCMQTENPPTIHPRSPPANQKFTLKLLHATVKVHWWK